MGMTFDLYAASAEEARRLEADPDSIYDFLVSRPEGAHLDLHKSWHGLHFTLAGDPWEGRGPLAFLLAGGEPLGEDLGYGPFRLMGAREVLATANALDALTDEEFDKRFDIQQLAEAEIYPRIWDESRESLLEEYLSYFRQLRKFVHDAARKKQSLVLLIG
jgi:Domain of unknown function (DUF1877)